MSYRLKCMAVRMYWTRSFQPSASRFTAAMRVSNPWQMEQWSTIRSFAVAAGKSNFPWAWEMSLQRTMPFCKAKSNEAFWSAVRFMPVWGSAVKPTARISRRYSPAGSFSIRYRPRLSESTIVVILVFVF